MAKRCMVNREIKKAKTVKKYAAKRAELKKQMLDMSLTAEQRETASKKFHSLPRNASPSRLRNRCEITGRPHGYYRKFGLSRNKLREHAMKGDIPGLVMASW
ncbi:SSU ribosomal protein S14p (S29e) [Methylophaga frappieri]|jgi:small subunit ribosomal protein S14|uniref:Small ribosomal subunit protein uS14 n=1 Tax=Methylophaga frappieri (strain ATCC BAA-2434 / DSM 25690 / JAM7) TaxID=754477 RepID=I1YKU7_METFJ|nr:30S ribosomal protein S14 [Methylophaga frappieri]AFJ03540.1 SSU ribosomal protein S14p (S29e) [Methylophaga frappieri]